MTFQIAPCVGLAHAPRLEVEGSIVNTVSEIDALKAENAALRDELSQLDAVGELQTRNQELFAENNQLLGRVRALESEVSRLGGGVL